MGPKQPSLKPRLFALAASLALCAALPAAAEEVIYGPDGAPTVVQRKRYPMSSRFETSLFFSTGLNHALTTHYGALLEETYHPNEWLDCGVGALYHFSGVSGLADQVRFGTRQGLPARAGAGGKTNFDNELSDSSQLRAAGLAQVRLAPFYGKFNIAGELAVHFQAFVTVGAGVGLLHHESVNLCGVATDKGNPRPCAPGDFLTWDAVKPLADIGGGFRFYFSNNWSLEAQLRSYLYPDSVIMGADLAVPSSGTRSTSLAVLTTLMVGVSVVY